MKYSLYIWWGVCMALAYVGLFVWSFKTNKGLYGWVALILAILSGLGGCARILNAIPGGP